MAGSSRSDVADSTLLTMPSHAFDAVDIPSKWLLLAIGLTALGSRACNRSKTLNIIETLSNLRCVNVPMSKVTHCSRCDCPLVAQLACTCCMVLLCNTHHELLHATHHYVRVAADGAILCSTCHCFLNGIWQFLEHTQGHAHRNALRRAHHT